MKFSDFETEVGALVGCRYCVVSYDVHRDSDGSRVPSVRVYVAGLGFIEGLTAEGVLSTLRLRLGLPFPESDMDVAV